MRGWFFVAVLLIGCGGAARNGTETPAPKPTVTGPPTVQTTLQGRWKSLPCSGRDYVRELNLYQDGTYEARDLVSPCPEGATCIWSGIEVHKGTWGRDADTGLVRLENESFEGRTTLPELPMPPELKEKDGNLLFPEGDCSFVRMNIVD